MFGIVNVVGTALKFVLKPALKLANKVPEGKLTGLGGLIGATGVALGISSGHIVTDQNIVAILKAVAEIVTALGTVVAAFGAQRAHTP